MTIPVRPDPTRSDRLMMQATKAAGLTECQCRQDRARTRCFRLVTRAGDRFCAPCQAGNHGPGQEHEYGGTHA